jgi:hypothetical protein
MTSQSAMDPAAVSDELRTAILATLVLPRIIGG